MIVAHGIAHVEAPLLDYIDNWFTCCSDCNGVNKHSAPPQPIPLEEASVPQLTETNEQLAQLSGLLKELVGFSKPPVEEAPVFNPELCQAKGAGCEVVGCQIPGCANYANFAYGESGGEVGKVVHEYDPHKTEW
jgi:hypothetical protein